MESNPAIQAPAVPALADGLVSNVIDPATANLIARVNAASITVEDMFLAAAEIQKLPLATCNREARTRCLARIFRGQNNKVIAVNFRLEAMARVVRSGKIRRWVLPNIVAEPVFVAAAKAPLLFTKNESFFDPESFIAFVRENAPVDGHA